MRRCGLAWWTPCCATCSTRHPGVTASSIYATAACFPHASKPCCELPPNFRIKKIPTRPLAALLELSNTLCRIYFLPIWWGSDFRFSRDTPARVCGRSRPPRGCGKGRGLLDNLAFRAVRFVAFSARSWRVVGMAPKQATLGYVRPSQTTIGWVDEGGRG